MQETLARTRESHQALLVSSVLTISLVVGAALFVGLFVARRTARRITRPLSELTRASERLAAGERTARVSIRSGDEMEVLGQSFNKMVSDLEASYSELERRNKELRREIEERKQAQAERGELQNHLIQAQKMEAFGQLAGGVAHDFNNILAVVLGNSELLTLTLEDGAVEEAGELNAEIAEAAVRGSNLTRQLLTFARREADNPRIVDVNQTMAGFDKLIRRVLEESVEVVFTTTSPLPKVRIDPGRLEQVLMNLCVNARDAMPSGGCLALSTSAADLAEPRQFLTGQAEPGRYVLVEARDTGTGMPKSVVERVFEPFFTTKAAGQGTGLGLATVHGIVKDARGFIDIESVEGQGTTFRVYLPAFDSDMPEEVAPQRQSLPAGLGRQVLLCEDDQSVRDMMARILQRAGYALTGVASGTEAVRALKENPYDILITDAVMPEMDGGQLAQAAHIHRPELPVLFVSGYTGGVLESCGVQEDSLNFLRKPFGTRDLLERIEAVIAARHGALPRSTTHD
jgi:signal transduction histidine kinase/ActR/RegA family two-component response regulator